MGISTPQRKALAVAGLCLVLLGAVGWEVMRWARPRTYELKSAVVTRLDARARSGEIRFVHPKSGRSMHIAAQYIPEGCEILVNGERAALADVRVGDTVSVRGLVNPLTHRVEPQWVHVRRVANSAEPDFPPTEPHTPTTAPADRPAPTEPGEAPPAAASPSATRPRAE